MRDYIHVFVNIDSDLDGLISVENFKKCFGSVMNIKQIHEIFLDSSTGEYRKMGI